MGPSTIKRAKILLDPKFKQRVKIFILREFKIAVIWYRLNLKLILRNIRMLPLQVVPQINTAINSKMYHK